MIFIYIESLTKTGRFCMLEVLKMFRCLFWRFWGVMFYVSLEEGRAHHWGLISCFPTSTFTCLPMGKALMFLHWEYWASRRISTFLILKPVQGKCSLFSVWWLHIADHKLPLQRWVSLSLFTWENVKHGNGGWFIHIISVIEAAVSWWLVP